MDTITPAHRSALKRIHGLLEGSGVTWVVTGSLRMALQGMAIAVHDIDIQTDRAGAYEIEARLSEFMRRSVSVRSSEKIRSHFGAAEIEGVSVEVMGDIQKRVEGEVWDTAPNLQELRRTVLIEGISVPVLSLEYEYGAYLRLGRTDKARAIRKWLDRPTWAAHLLSRQEWRACP